MTNFEWITRDVDTLTVFLCDKMWCNCDFCPVKKKCKEHGDTTKWNDCLKRVREWMKREA